MTTQVYDITITGCLFAQRKIEDPIKYVRGVFKSPHKINILKHSGRMIIFRVADFFDQEGFDFTELISSLTYDPPTNITYEMNFSTRIDDGLFEECLQMEAA